MEPTFVVINQLGQYLNKHKAFISGRDSQLVYRTIHKDDALNHVFEMSSKDIELRARVMAVELDEKGQPIIEPGPLSESELERINNAQHGSESLLETDENQDLPAESVNEAINSENTLENNANQPT